jgi:hypothetical protein
MASKDEARAPRAAETFGSVNAFPRRVARNARNDPDSGTGKICNIGIETDPCQALKHHELAEERLAGRSERLLEKEDLAAALEGRPDSPDWRSLGGLI